MKQARNYQRGVSTVTFPTTVRGAGSGLLTGLRHVLMERWMWLLLGVASVYSVVSQLTFLFPGLYEVDAFDQSLYIFRGRAFAQSVLTGNLQLPDPAWNPLGSVLYGLAYLPNQDSPSWFLRVEWMARTVLYAGLWTAMLAVARALRPVVHPVWLLGMLAAITAFPFVLYNNSDALFAILSGLALSQMLRFLQGHSTGRLALAGVFLGLGALTRADGLVLTGTAALAVLAITLRDSVGGTRVTLAGNRLLALLLPVMLLVGGYQTLYSVSRGAASTDLSERTYMAFEQGEGASYAGDPKAAFERTGGVRSLYGTPEENGHSIFAAIQRNPQAFGERVVHIVTSGFTEAAWLVYGPFTSFLVGVCALAGVVVLTRGGKGDLALLLGAWSLHLGVYLLTFVRTGYLALPFTAILALAAVGAQALARSGERSRKLAFAAVVVAALVVVQSAFLGYTIYPSGVAPLAFEPAEVKAAHYMETTFAPGTRVASFAPRAIWQAEMEPVLTGVPVAFEGLVPVSGDLSLYAATSVQDVLAWMRDHSVDTLYLDPYLSMWQPKLYALVEGGIGREFEVTFSAQEESPRNLAYLQVLANRGPVDVSVRVLRVRAAGQ